MNRWRALNTIDPEQTYVGGGFRNIQFKPSGSPPRTHLLQESSRTGKCVRTIAIASPGVPSVSAALGNHLIPPFLIRRIPSEK